MGTCIPHLKRIRRKQKQIKNGKNEEKKEIEVFDTNGNEIYGNNFGGEVQNGDENDEIIYSREEELMNGESERDIEKGLETEPTEYELTSQAKIDESEIVQIEPYQDSFIKDKFIESDKENKEPLPEDEEKNFTFAKKITFYENAKELPTVMELSLEQAESSILNSKIMNSQILKSSEERRIDQNPMILESKWTQGKIYGAIS